MTLDNWENEQRLLEMKVKKVIFSKIHPGRSKRHCAAFLTTSGQVILVDKFTDEVGDIWPYFNSSDALRLARDVMEGKKKAIRIAPILQGLGVIAWETRKPPKLLVDMAKNRQIVNCVVIENIPDNEEELYHFAMEALKEIH